VKPNDRSWLVIDKVHQRPFLSMMMFTYVNYLAASPPDLLLPTLKPHSALLLGVIEYAIKVDVWY
jgi:hypothetical protein